MNSDIVSRPYDVNPEKACEACIFGRGEHTPWCESIDATFQHLRGRARLADDVEHHAAD